jgi:hypothetical protein
MATVAVTGEDLGALASQLPHGRTFDSGRAFVPFVKATLFDQIAQHLPEETRQALSAAGQEDHSQPIEHRKDADLPTDWSKLKAGHVVLAEESSEEGWWEAVVIAAKDNDVFELRWRDWPENPAFIRHRTRLALMHPRLTPAKS